MKKITFLRNLIVLVALLVGSGSAMGQTTINFDNAGSWVQDGSTALTSYANHAYVESGVTIQGTNVLRNATAAQDGFPGALGTYSMRVGNTALSKVAITVATGGVAEFSIKVRRWDNSPMPNYTVKYSVDGGSNWTSLTKIDGTLLTTSNFFTYSSGVINSAVSNFKIEIQNTGTTERIMLDDFTWTGYIGGGTPTVATPSIEVTSGVAKTTDTYFNTAEVTLSSSTDGASIYYTLDGNDPTTSSTLYSAPFNVTTTSTVKALAVKTDMDDSGIASKTITIVAPATATVPYSEAFNNTLGDWYNYEVAGTKPWYASADGAIANGYNGGDVESWLISPKFTATEDGLNLTFNYASKYVGDPILVKVSSDYIGYGSPAAANWTTLSTILAPEVQDDAYTVKLSGNIINAASGTTYFALVYDAAAAPYSDWRITNASIDLPPAGPTITVTEAEVPAMSAYADATDTETITVNGLNLTGDITLALSGTDAAQFSLSTSTLSPTAGSVTDASVTITYEPTAAGSHTATLTLSSAGASDVTKSLSGTATWAPLDAPVATAASGLSSSGFTANWEAVTGATEYELSVYTKEESVVNATDLFISEYVEGSSSNKYIEVFNGTGVSVDLSDYQLLLFGNGSSTASNTAQLSGTLANGSTMVYKNSSAALTLPLGVTAENNTAVNFNGDDAVALYKISTSSYVDIFGRIGNDPGSAWTGDGGYTTVDKTLIRKSSVTNGITESPTGTGATAFTTLTTEWDLYATDYADNLGSHTFAGVGYALNQITGSPFTVTGETSKAITALTASTTYYYTVKAKNVNVTSDSSNEISAITSFGTSTDNPSSLTSIYAHNAKIHFTATAGEKVEVYNAVGQKIISTLATDGQNELPVNAKGVMIVKVGSRLAKVIL
jgi:hypothetical protein